MAESSGSSETPREGLKDLVDRFGLTEVLGYIFPGVILLSAIFIWVKPDIVSAILGPQLAQNQFVVGMLVVIFAYASGHIISMHSMVGAEDFRKSYRPRSPFGSDDYVRFAREWIKWKWLWFTVGISEKIPDEPKCEALLDIEQKLGALMTIQSVPLLRGKAEQLLALRALAADQLKDKVSSLIAEADVSHRRLMFSLGVALALLVLALSAFLRLAVAALATWRCWLMAGLRNWNDGHPTQPLILTLVIAGACYLSFKLRRVAVHCWEKEIVMTLAILRRFPYRW